MQENLETFESVYSLDKSPIGTGAFAEVWLCTHKRTKDVRAAKIFDKSSLTEEEIKTRSVLIEVEILKSLDHPNILKVYEYFEDTLKYYIVMEYARAGTCTRGRDLNRKVRLEDHETDIRSTKLLAQQTGSAEILSRKMY